ncbi:hypothetical protein BDP27DRAFT_1310838 [Rhodocollybia butyracea]|uniref:SnoaL-like domain-containing protein n=1 Tax=Rhodocollybia butyracea TaxID=206335 RepID=A0A9P5UG96_9AGAR|nr:hypothetical protein BDP27DRAFT_1273882 [Rhodocollybia butyracea]KAF9078136.1 hypothetical protein BDP27DRAFT_1310838 [Rhodocollybia butyracea]
MSQRRQTALAIIDAYNNWDLPAILSFRDSNCIHQILPKSLNRPPLSNSDYETYFTPWLKAFTNFHVTINDIFEDEKENKIVLWAQSTSDSVIGPYDNEYMLAFYFNEDGDKVVRMLEFVNSTVSVDFFPRLRKYFEGEGAAEAVPVPKQERKFGDGVIR